MIKTPHDQDPTAKEAAMRYAPSAPHDRDPKCPTSIFKNQWLHVFLSHEMHQSMVHGAQVRVAEDGGEVRAGLLIHTYMR